MDPSAFRVYLRALEPDDYKASIAWRQDEQIWQMVVGRRYLVSEEYERRWVARVVEGSSSELTLAVCLKSEDRHIGNVYLRGMDSFNWHAVSSVLIGEKAFWGSGLSTEAMPLLLRHSFADLGRERVETRILTTNGALVRLHEECGFWKEGVMCSAAFKDGRSCDVTMMSRLRQQFAAAWESSVASG